MAKEKTRREKRLFQLMVLIVGCVISVFLNGFFAVGSYMQHQNITKMKQENTSLVELVSNHEEQQLLQEERLQELSQSILLMQREMEELQKKMAETKVPSSNGKKIAYLTFDDGPTQLTPKVLDVLKEYEAKATFFVLGNNVKKLPEVAKRIVEEGHAIANHTHTHRYEKLYGSIEGLQAEIKYCNDEIYKATGVQATAFRFPGGSSNTMMYTYSPSSTRQQWYDAVHEMSMEYHDWNVSSLDASGRQVSAAEIVQSVVGGARNKNQINVLMHDVNKNTATLEALPEIIVRLKEMGYSLEAITSNTIPVQHKISE